jgi:hypothetical protein
MSRITPVATDRSGRIDLLRGMLGTLERITPTGHPELMEDILRLLRQEALDPAAHFGASQRRTVVRSLDDLEHEVSRLDPDRGHFDRKAHTLIDVLAVS